MVVVARGNSMRESCGVLGHGVYGAGVDRCPARGHRRHCHRRGVARGAGTPDVAAHERLPRTSRRGSCSHCFPSTAWPTPCSAAPTSGPSTWRRRSSGHASWRCRTTSSPAAMTARGRSPIRRSTTRARGLAAGVCAQLGVFDLASRRASRPSGVACGLRPRARRRGAAPRPGRHRGGPVGASGLRSRHVGRVRRRRRAPPWTIPTRATRCSATRRRS